MEDLVIHNLFENMIYAKKVLPFLKPSYFEQDENRLIIKAYKSYTKKYNSHPSYSVIKTGIIQNVRLSESVVKSAFDKIVEFEESKPELYDPDWLFDQAELHCQQISLVNAIIKSGNIIDDPDIPNGEIAKIVTDALSISFNINLGIDIFNKIDMKRCYDYYVKDDEKIECHLTKLNEVFYLLKKSCTCLLSPTHGGKTNAMCALGTGYVKKGNNVLYITGEMREEEISKIIYANLMNIVRNDMATTSEMMFMGHHKTFELKSKTWGRYQVKEFPTSTVNMNIINAYIDDIELKRGYKFDVIILDYLNLFLPTTSKASDNSYTSIKRVAEEFRALCVIRNLAGLTATQTNRDGAKTADFDMTDTSESFGLPATMDGMIALIGTSDLKAQNLQIWKILKNRYTGIIDYKIPFRTQFEYGNVIDLSDDVEVPLEFNNPPLAITMAKKMRNKKFDNGVVITLDSDEKSDMEELLI